jgi:alkylated DNA repair protein alkB family protein 6
MLSLLKKVKASGGCATSSTGAGGASGSPKAEGGEGLAPEPRIEEPPSYTLTLPAAPLAEEHIVSPLPYGSVCYHQNVIDCATAGALVHSIDAAATKAMWVEVKGRRLQQWGGQPMPEGVQNLAPLPPFLSWIADSLLRCGVFPHSHPPNHCLINDYSLDEGILAHTDGPRYHPCVATLSLLDASVMRFSVLHGRENSARGERGGQLVGELVLQRNSLVVTWGDLYSVYAHSILEEKESVLGESCPLWGPGTKGGKFTRQGRRLSLTFRHVI